MSREKAQLREYGGPSLKDYVLELKNFHSVLYEKHKIILSSEMIQKYLYIYYCKI